MQFRETAEAEAMPSVGDDDLITAGNVEMAEPEEDEAIPQFTCEIVENMEAPYLTVRMDHADRNDFQKKIEDLEKEVEYVKKQMTIHSSNKNEDVIDLTDDFDVYEPKTETDNQPWRFVAVSSTEETLPAFLPLPEATDQASHSGWKAIPPRPVTIIDKSCSELSVSWIIDGYNPELHAAIASYQIYVCEETSSGSKLVGKWQHVSDVDALPQPMTVKKKYLAGEKSRVSKKTTKTFPF